MSTEVINREYLTTLVRKTLEPLDGVKAMWEAGSVSFNRTDEWSDIDLMVIAEEDSIADAFKAVEDSLQGVTEIDIAYDVPNARAEGFYQKFYRLKGLSRFMLIDLAIFPLDAPNKYLEREIHNEPLLHFDKGDYTRCDPINMDEYSNKLKEGKEKLKIRFSLFDMVFEKDMNRGHYLEAMDFYNSFLIGSLIMALRLDYSPFHYAFRSKYIYYELPQDIVKRLEGLYFVRDERDLKSKYAALTEWFYEVVKEV